MFVVVLIADKHNIPKGKMHDNCSLEPDARLDAIAVISNNTTLHMATQPKVLGLILEPKFTCSTCGIYIHLLSLGI